MKIFKYILLPIDRQTISIPSPARILSVIEQRENIVLYAMVEEGKEEIPIDILIFGTGHTLPTDIDKYNFIGSVKLYGGDLT